MGTEAVLEVTENLIHNLAKQIDSQDTVDLELLDRFSKLVARYNRSLENAGLSKKDVPTNEDNNNNGRPPLDSLTNEEFNRMRRAGELEDYDGREIWLRDLYYEPPKKPRLMIPQEKPKLCIPT